MNDEENAVSLYVLYFGLYTLPFTSFFETS